MREATVRSKAAKKQGIAPMLIEIEGQASYTLASDAIELAITRTGGMMAPVSFFADESNPVRPYAIAPWATETLPGATPAMLQALRGDWFCSAFGENRDDPTLPPHGETANCDWEMLARSDKSTGSWLQLGMDLPRQGGRCVATTALVAGHSVIYQRHDLSGLRGPISPGHHATLSFPPAEGSGRLSFSPFRLARTCPVPVELPQDRGYSWLAPDRAIQDLTKAPCIDGNTTDLTAYPARRGFEDIAIICADPELPFAWSAVTFAEQGYVWFALRNPSQLASTLLWFSNGGRHFPPWNGRHVNVMGIEDITAYFHFGRSASHRPNPLVASGIPTTLDPVDGGLSIFYIQGAARIGKDFDQVADIVAGASGQSMTLIARSGAAVTVSCDIAFLRYGRLTEIALPLPTSC